MSLRLLFHPLSSFCQKALIALFENDTPFTPQIVDLGDPADRDAFLKLWPIGKFPVLRDEARDLTIPEATIIIEYLDTHYPGAKRLVPADADQAWRMRLWDRVYDLYVNDPMQKIVGNRLRPADAKDPTGVAQARARLQTSYDLIEREMADKTWAMGEEFGMADCAAAPALFYANLVEPFGDGHKTVRAYFDRLMARPSFARAVAEAKPYFHPFPQETEAA
jgi:glutathione S-transferase